MFDSFRVTREQALNYSELVSEKRGLFSAITKFGGKAAVSDGTKVAGDAAVGDGAKVASKSLGQKAKNFLLSLVVGGVAADAGTYIYGDINPNSPALGGTGEPQSTNAPPVINTPANTAYNTSPGSTTAGSTTTSESSIPSHV
jgi:hypothetical protein